MKLREKYVYLKKDYSEYIILIKSGNFYITFNNDAIILNNIFNYKIINDKLGFPLSSITKIINNLQNKKINYVIDNNSDNLIINSGDINNYLSYYEEAKNYEFKCNLNKCLLDKITFLIENNEDNYEKIRRFIDEF